MTTDRAFFPLLILRCQAMVRRFTFARRFTVVVRWLLAAAFLPSGLKKVQGVRFTNISVDSPVGSFFEAFFQAHEYYLFVGLVQVAAALLLLWPRTALLGATIFLPVIVNIVVITWALHFRGTWLVTLALLCANLYLLFWDADRVLPLAVRSEKLGLVASPGLSLKSCSVRTSILLVLGLGSVGLLAGLGFWTGPSALVGAWLLVLGAMVFSLFLAAVWECLAALRGHYRRDRKDRRDRRDRQDRY